MTKIALSAHQRCGRLMSQAVVGVGPCSTANGIDEDCGRARAERDEARG
jgi:hypothetical protein